MVGYLPSSSGVDVCEPNSYSVIAHHKVSALPRGLG